MLLGGSVGMQTLTIIIADDHPLFRGALRQAVQGIAEKVLIIEAGDFEAARRAADSNPEADLMLLDLAMPGVSGFSGLMSLRAEFSLTTSGPAFRRFSRAISGRQRAIPPSLKKIPALPNSWTG